MAQREAGCGLSVHPEGSGQGSVSTSRALGTQKGCEQGSDPVPGDAWRKGRGGWVRAATEFS